MRTYQKRIGFLINSEHIKSTGGNGQFARSFCELMLKNDIKVDIITDKPPHYKEYANSLGVNIIIPDNPYKDGKHSAIFAKPDSYNLEKMLNFRNSILKAMETNMYDVFVCNSPESIFTAISLGMSENIQIIAYTHLESQIFTNTSNPFCSEANELMRQNLTTSGIYIATQSEFNTKQFNRPNVYECPIPLTELTLLQKYNNIREGVLFVGRWEPGKNPTMFIDLIKQTKLPAKVLTSPNGVIKFEEALKPLGVKYEIKHSLVGQQKVDFITSARVAFNPSVVESYGMAFHEQTIQLPTVALDGMRWLNNFNKDYYYTCDKKSMAEIVSLLYNEFDDAKKWYNIGVIDYYTGLENQVFSKWQKCFNLFSPKKVKNDNAAINQHRNILYARFIKSLQRTQISLGNDIRSIYNNKHKFDVVYTDNHTHLIKDPKNYVITDENEVKPDIQPIDNTTSINTFDMFFSEE